LASLTMPMNCSLPIFLFLDDYNLKKQTFTKKMCFRLISDPRIQSEPVLPILRIRAAEPTSDRRTRKEGGTSCSFTCSSQMSGEGTHIMIWYKVLRSNGVQLLFFFLRGKNVKITFLKIKMSEKKKKNSTSRGTPMQAPPPPQKKIIFSTRAISHSADWGMF